MTKECHALHPDQVARAARLHRRCALIAAPWIFQFSDDTAATVVPVVLGIGLIVYSLFTNYELGIWKVAPMAVHNLSTSPPARCSLCHRGCSASPTTGAKVWVPHLVVGLAAIFLGLTTVQQGGYSYRTASTAH